MAETTFYSDADPENTSVDGFVRHNAAASTWLSLRAGAGTHSGDSDNVFAVRFDSDASTDLWKNIYRSILLFDTSSLSNEDIITKVQLILVGSTRVNTLGIVIKLGVVSSFPASNIGLVPGDFDSLGVTLLSNKIASDVWSVGGDNTFTLTGVGRASISKTGITRLGLRETEYDIAAVAPPWSSNKLISLEIKSADAGGSNRPRLVVTHGTLLYVTTQECTDTIAEKTTGHGTLIRKGSSPVTEHGHVWDTSPNPTTANSKTENGAKPNLGQFTSDITGILPDTTYFVAAYATNTEGTFYGDDVTIGSGSTIGRRDWWVERDEFHFWSEWGVEQKVKGTSVANDQDILAHLGL